MLAPTFPMSPSAPIHRAARPVEDAAAGAPAHTSDPAAAEENSGVSRRRWMAEGWLADAGYHRLIVALAILGNLAGWLVDRSAVGPGSLAFVLLGVHVLGAILALPALAATFAPRLPGWFDRAMLTAIGGCFSGVLVGMALAPTTASEQGWGMLIAWVFGGLAVGTPLRHKIALHFALYVFFAIIVVRCSREMGPSYARPSEIFSVLLGTAIAAVGLPFVTHQLERRRLLERSSRERLEREVALREGRERELLLRERELLEEKARADRAAEEARQSAASAAREARMRTELFANMSHDLRTPMAGILGLVELMGNTPLDAEQANYVETIRASNQTLLSLLDDVIDFARIDEGKLPLLPVSAPLVETLRRPASLMRVAAERKELELLVDLPDSLPSHVKIDPARVQQIVLNLLGNAIKFTQQGKVTLRATMRIQDGESRLRVEIEDTGIGFTAAQRDRLFRRFSQAEDGIAQRFGGSGLGLSICRGLVELMGGQIGAEGEPGRGALFWFEIPAEETRSPSIDAPDAPVPSLRVLLAEDNPVNQLVLSMMLKKLGQEVIVASDGEQALRLLMQERFHLAIMDMKMPVMDGEDVTRRIRGASARAGLTYVVALTASATAEEQARFLAAGVDAVYTKPIDMDRLRRLLRKEGAAAEARLGLFTKKRPAR